MNLNIHAHLLLIILLIAIPCGASSQSLRNDSLTSDAQSMHKHQQARVDSLNARMAQSYQEILEKTNQQLSLLYNPLAIMIGGLSVLFTVLTIVAVFIVYRQGKDYKERLETFMNENQILFEGFLNEKQAEVEALKTQSNDLKTKQENSTPEERTRLQVELDKVKAQQDSVNREILSTIAITPATGSVMRERFQRCTHCGHRFRHAPLATDFFVYGKSTIQCPNCRKQTHLSFWGES